MFDKEAYEKVIVVGEAGAGMVKVTVNGLGYPTKIEIDDSLFVSKDKEFVCDLLIAAIVDGLRKSDEEVKKIMTEQYNKAYEEQLNKLQDVVDKYYNSPGNGNIGGGSSKGKMN